MLDQIRVKFKDFFCILCPYKRVTTYYHLLLMGLRLYDPDRLRLTGERDRLGEYLLMGDRLLGEGERLLGLGDLLGDTDLDLDRLLLSLSLCSLSSFSLFSLMASSSSLSFRLSSRRLFLSASNDLRSASFSLACVNNERQGTFKTLLN